MSYRVLALKYRPQTFDEVIGQPQVTTTLTNAILSGRVPHAILLTGPRGTGKTTIARIIAKAMNCANGPTPTPCNVCKSCTSITAGNDVDVFEIDGASNNSVDQVRELRENVAYMPSSSKFKIYIIDEVHMLSMAAFNALLKTLEEPPDHVIFIFATTEVHKIPVTILSRCQRHDLGRITLSQISSHLMKLAADEGFTLARESCDLIAGEADGSMRDSLSLLDRILGSQAQPQPPEQTPDQTSDKPLGKPPEKREVNHKEILATLGILDKTLVFDLATAVLENRAADILDLVDHIHNLGLDLKRFYASLIRHFRNLAVVKISNNDKNTCDVSDHDRQRMAALTAPLSQVFLNQILNTLLNDESLVKFSSHTRTAVEMVLLKLVQVRPGVEIDEIIKRLDDLAQRFDSPGVQGPPIEIENDRPHAPSGASPPPGASRQDSVRQNMQPPTPQPQAAPPRFEPGSEPGTAPIGEAPAPRHPKTDLSQTDPSPEDLSRKWQPFLTALAGSLPSASAILTKGRLQKISNTDIIVELNVKAFERGRIESKQSEIDSLIKDFFGRQMKLIMVGECTPEDYGIDEKSPARKRQEILNHPLVADAIKRFNASVVDVKLKERNNP
ncbi:MAG: DNA polymerase III subunit gamma/tau [Desulfobacterium sp.]|nr:DNA polymerase III subunit gamma/tau [Desulfobacterium sp.]